MSVRDNLSAVRDATGIPMDEPIFILRAQDASSVDALDEYIQLQEIAGNDPSFLENLRQVRNSFEDWQIKNSQLVKRAD